mmetsp:Transcript_18667/g.19426  ORF Transcript_18667/g.19426 Transcript_18667/m.19426 type:complete len:100 (+) Transcript_18667:1-300(+)
MLESISIEDVYWKFHEIKRKNYEKVKLEDKIITELKNRLIKAGADIYCDENGLREGTSWWKAEKTMISQDKIVLLEDIQDDIVMEWIQSKSNEKESEEE